MFGVLACVQVFNFAQQRGFAVDQSRIEEWKPNLVAASTRRRESQTLQRAAGRTKSTHAPSLQHELQGLLRSSFSKAGFDLEKLDSMLAQIQKDKREAFAKQAEEAARHAARDRQAMRDAVQKRQKTYEILNRAREQNPHLIPSWTVLDRPFVIWQLPHPNLSEFIDSKIESLNSTVRFRVNTNSGSENSAYIFYFVWENATDYYAVLNAETTLILNGMCELFAAPGFFSGDSCFIYLSASLTPFLIQPDGSWQLATPQTGQSQGVLGLNASGGGLFSSTDIESQTLSNQPFDLNYKLLLVPDRTTVVFEVGLDVSYGFSSGGGNISDLIYADFADEASFRSVICPSVNLELLTAPSSTASV